MVRGVAGRSALEFLRPGADEAVGEVLHHAQRADPRAVDAPEEQREQHQQRQCRPCPGAAADHAGEGGNELQAFDEVERRVAQHRTDETGGEGEQDEGGEQAAQVMFDAIIRLLPGVLGNALSAESESFENGLLEYPQYTRPVEWQGRRVPEVLLGGHHRKIADWRKEQALRITAERRPDLLKKYLDSKRV